MKEIKRDIYLNKLISRKDNGLIKIITGIRRCGKSYLLDPLFKNYLLDSGIKEDHIIKLELDKEENKKYHDPHELNQYIKSQIKDKSMYYILLDEIQMTTDFESVLNSFLYERNLDVYVTGSNSKFLSSDIITEFRGRGDEIKIYPGHYYQSDRVLDISCLDELIELTEMIIDNPEYGEEGDMYLGESHLKYRKAVYHQIYDYLYNPEKI